MTLSIETADRVVIAGDWHGNVDWARQVLKAAVRAGIRTVIQVGDFGMLWANDEPLNAVSNTCVELGVELFWFDGNHENFDLMADRGALPSGDEPVELAPSVWYLPRGFRWNNHDRTWMSVGGAYSVDKAHRVEGRSWWSQEEITEADLMRAAAPGPVDVLLTHDIPTLVDIPGMPVDWKTHFPAAIPNHQRIDALVKECTPSLLVHGHMHVRYTGRIRFDGVVRGRRMYALTTVEGLSNDYEPGNAIVIDTPTVVVSELTVDSLSATPRRWI